MLTNVQGRIEADPMAFPQAANPADADDAFATVLDAAIDATEPVRVDARHVEDRRVDDVDAEIEAEADEIPAPAADEATRDAAASDQFATLPTDAETAAAAGEHAAANTAADGKVADASLADAHKPTSSEARADAVEAPRPAGKPTAEPLLAAMLNPAAPPAANAASPAKGNDGGVTAVGAARGVDAPTRGVAMPMARQNGPLAAPAVQAGYRTNGAASAELIEQARDSVFQQILVKLSGEGGEMRLTLQPPDLGQLDLRLVMDPQNRLNLTIAAERQDMAHLLQRHLDELKHVLQQAGLDVAGAEVQTRGEFERQQQQRDAQQHGAAVGAELESQPTTVRPRGFARAGGLDFWA